MESLYAIAKLRNKPGPLPDPLAKLSYSTDSGCIQQSWSLSHVLALCRGETGGPGWRWAGDAAGCALSLPEVEIRWLWLGL